MRRRRYTIRNGDKVTAEYVGFPWLTGVGLRAARRIANRAMVYIESPDHYEMTVERL